MIRLIWAFALCFGSAAAAQDGAAASGLGVVLRGLDKVNGRTVDVEVSSGGIVQVFGLDVGLADCRYPAENPTGDAFAFLTIREKGVVLPEFEGWMIASSPAL
ncbi:MAG: DUF2155 domain-containing protein, partial [Rhodobacteraceae bacterium]|nr:DUF2155 domain-containing protein [Paracoccaceae bacterium]